MNTFPHQYIGAYMNRRTLVIILFTITSFCLILLRIYVQNEVDILNFEHHAIQEEVKEVRRQNKLLEEQILYHSSLINISEKAEGEGYIEATYEILWGQ